MAEDSMDEILARMKSIFDEGEAMHARGEATLGDIVSEAIEMDMYGKAERIAVPTIQGNRFSQNDRWARAVKAEVDRLDAEYADNHEGDGTQIDRTWVVLMALPGALHNFDGAVPSTVHSSKGTDT